jgi:hypothetical protein
MSGRGRQQGGGGSGSGSTQGSDYAVYLPAGSAWPDIVKKTLGQELEQPVIAISAGSLWEDLIEKTDGRIDADNPAVQSVVSALQTMQLKYPNLIVYIHNCRVSPDYPYGQLAGLLASRKGDYSYYSDIKNSRGVSLLAKCLQEQLGKAGVQRVYRYTTMVREAGEASRVELMKPFLRELQSDGHFFRAIDDEAKRYLANRPGIVVTQKVLDQMADTESASSSDESAGSSPGAAAGGGGKQRPFTVTLTKVDDYTTLVIDKLFSPDNKTSLLNYLQFFTDAYKALIGDMFRRKQKLEKQVEDFGVNVHQSVRTELLALQQQLRTFDPDRYHLPRPELLCDILAGFGLLDGFIDMVESEVEGREHLKSGRDVLLGSEHCQGITFYCQFVNYARRCGFSSQSVCGENRLALLKGLDQLRVHLAAAHIMSDIESVGLLCNQPALAKAKKFTLLYANRGFIPGVALPKKADAPSVVIAHTVKLLQELKHVECVGWQNMCLVAANHPKLVANPKGVMLPLINYDEAKRRLLAGRTSRPTTPDLGEALEGVGEEGFPRTLERSWSGSSDSSGFSGSDLSDGPSVEKQVPFDLLSETGSDPQLLLERFFAHTARSQALHARHEALTEFILRAQVAQIAQVKAGKCQFPWLSVIGCSLMAGVAFTYLLLNFGSESGQYSSSEADCGGALLSHLALTALSSLLPLIRETTPLLTFLMALISLVLMGVSLHQVYSGNREGAAAADACVMNGSLFRTDSKGVPFDEGGLSVCPSPRS